VGPSRIVAAIVAGLVLFVAVILLMSETRMYRIAGAVMVIVFLVFTVALDWFQAWSNERHVEKHPHLLRNDAIGERVTASGKFCLTGGVGTGLVILSGEKWKARCRAGYLPEDGEILSVESREGLTLFVQPKGSDA